MKLEGRRGIITLAQQEGKTIATKSAKDASKKGAINKESQIISYLNQHNITFVPQLREQGDGWFNYERIPGEHFKTVYKHQDQQGKEQLARKLLERAYQLDTVRVVHGELIRPFTNVLVQEDGEIAIIDFERGSIGDDSGKNMRSYSQRLLAQGHISLTDCKHIGTMDKDEMYQYLSGKLKAGSEKQKMNIFLALTSISGLLFLDQFTKYIFYNLQRGSEFLLLTPAFNTGIGWSLPIPLSFVLFLTIIVMGGILRAWKHKHITTRVTILLLAGAGGNFLDRIFLQGVRDFVDLHYRPIFNFADMYLTGAVILLLILTRKEAHDH